MSLSEFRTSVFQRNELLEALLTELSADLQPAENLLISRNAPCSVMQYPLIFIMGPLRSGTTLFTQWLANTGLVSYPTNLLSRFYQAPIIGAKIQLLLTDPRYNFRDELGEFIQQAEYCSENGKTKGALAPNEFWYFWRRFLSDPARDIWTDDELQEGMDTQTMLAELTGIMSVFDKPFAAKGMLFNYNIPFFNRILDKAIFIQIKRDPISNVASVLEARTRQLGSEREWYSFKIPEYEQLKNSDPITQAAGQVHFINKAVTDGLSAVSDTRKLVVEYEDFCSRPNEYFEQLKTLLGCADIPYLGPEHFSELRQVDPISKSSILASLSVFLTVDNLRM
jgi:hypothetical protein